MTTLTAILTGSSSALLFLLAVIHVSSRRRSAQKTLFILSAAIASAAAAALTLALISRSPEDVMRRLQIHLALLIFSPALFIPFFAFFGRSDADHRMRRWLPGMITLGTLLAAAALLVPVELVISRFQIAEGGGLWRIGVTPFGQMLALLALAINVLILHSFENTYRAATVPAKVSLKYPLLGTILASVMNFIMMSRLVLLSEVDNYFISAGALGMIIFCITVLYAGWRYPVFEVKTVMETGKAPSVVTVVISGLYLLAFALITWTSDLIGMPYHRLGTMVLSVFTIFVLLAVLISGKARRQLRIFVNENFRPGLYNYRREWRYYARLMTSCSTVDDLLANTISSLCETMMVKKGLIYAGISGGRAADYGLEKEEIADASSGGMMELYSGSPIAMIPGHRRLTHATDRQAGPDTGIGETPGWVRAISFLTIGGEPRGFIALGRKDFGRLWSEEDRDFLATITDQAALALENLLMEERHLESKQLESFNRFASFVIHDLKNTVGMLSLTAENARDNIHDREFQEDAIDTIERSVQKMRRLIDSLNAHKSPTAISRAPTDMASTAAEKIDVLRQLASKKGVAVSLESEESVSAFVDQAAISRIVENLVLNSIEATGEGGSVEVRLARHGKTLTITVSDDGPGFDCDFLENGLFRPFMSTKKNGLGVGLVLCKSLTEAHGGSISVSSLPGGGATVKVEIPAGG
jgi:putative PEP-CTERM system histidine kinase